MNNVKLTRTKKWSGVRVLTIRGATPYINIAPITEDKVADEVTSTLWFSGNQTAATYIIHIYNTWVLFSISLISIKSP